MTNYKKAETMTNYKKSVEKVTFQRPQVQAGLMKPTEIRTQTPDVRLSPAPRTLRLKQKIISLGVTIFI